MRKERCKGCGQEIVWIRMFGGKTMPCDPEPVLYRQMSKGRDRVITPNGETLVCKVTTVPDSADGIGYLPHWSTCPEAARFKRGG